MAIEYSANKKGRYGYGSSGHFLVKGVKRKYITENKKLYSIIFDLIDNEAECIKNFGKEKIANGQEIDLYEIIIEISKLYIDMWRDLKQACKNLE